MFSRFLVKVFLVKIPKFQFFGQIFILFCLAKVSFIIPKFCNFFQSSKSNYFNYYFNNLIFLTPNFYSLTHSLSHFDFFVFGGHVFGVGQCNASCLGIFVKQLPINCFWKIQVVMRRTSKFYSSGPEKVY